MFLRPPVSILKTNCSKPGRWAGFFAGKRLFFKWRAPCFKTGMSKFAFTVDKKSGHIDTMLITANRAKKIRFRRLRRVAIAILLIVAAELLYLLAP
jgi:hypothetical protein